MGSQENPSRNLATHGKALEIYRWDEEEDAMKVEPIVKKFKQYCNIRRNITWERHTFNTRNQMPGETVDYYATDPDLRTKARTCVFANLLVTDGLIRDRIVCGITDDHTRSRLLRETDLSLKKTLDTCRASEATSAQMKSLTLSEGGAATAILPQCVGDPFDVPWRINRLSSAMT